MKLTVFLIMCGALGVTVGVVAARWLLSMLQDFDNDSIWEDEDDWL